MTRISVFIVDDHTLFRTGLRGLLVSRNLDVVGMTGYPEEAVELLQQSRPDIVLLDLRMRELGGLELLRQIRVVLPDQTVVILTTSVDENDLIEALRLGADGYLLKAVSYTHLTLPTICSV